MSSTEERRAAIRALLAEREVRSQGELHELLASRGYPASQPVVSRDLRALGVVKRVGIYQLLEEERVTPLTALKSLLRGAEPVEHFVLLTCEPGAASAVARALEAEELQGLSGTIAGDDTVLVATTTRSAAQRVRRRVLELL